MYLGMCSSVVIGVQCFGINRKVKVSRDQWQFEFKIVRRLTPDLGAFEKALEGPLLILSNWYRF
jgi:hypothetical protein